jgi:hypothetical protein
MSTNFKEYIIHPKHKLIIEKFSGKCSSQDFINLKTNESNDPLYNKNYNFIVDIRTMEFNSGINDLETFLTFVKNSKNLNGQRKSAFLVNKPLQIAIITLYKKKTMELPMQFNLYSSLKGAINFLELKDLNYTEVEELLNIPESH